MRFFTNRIRFAPGGSFVCGSSGQTVDLAKREQLTVGLERDIREGKGLRHGHEVWRQIAHRSPCQHSQQSQPPADGALLIRIINRPLEDDNRYKVVNFWTFVPSSPDPPVPKANPLSHTSRINPQRRPWLPVLQSLLGYLYEPSKIGRAHV